MAYDVDRLRAHVPALREGAAHFDGPGGTQIPDQVADAMNEAYKHKEAAKSGSYK